MINKNKPFEYPYGKELKELFDKIYEGSIFAIENGLFKFERPLEPVAKRDDYFSSGTNVYRNADKYKYLAAVEMISMVDFFGQKNSDFVGNDSFKEKIKYYSKFQDEIAAVIKADPKLEGLSVYMAMRDYGDHRLEELDRFDIRIFNKLTGASRELK